MSDNTALATTEPRGLQPPAGPDPTQTMPGPMASEAAWWHYSHGLETWTAWLEVNPGDAIPRDFFPDHLSGPAHT